MSAAELVVLVPIGLLVGAFSALFGVGGGVIVVPVLVIGFGFEQHLAQGTSLAVIVPTAVAGAVAHHKRGYLDLPRAARLGAGGVAGVALGAWVALAISGDVLRDIFGLFLVLTGLRLTFQATRPGPRPRT